MKTLTRFSRWSFVFVAPPPARAQEERSAEAAHPARCVSLSADESAAMNELRSSTLRAMFPLLFSRWPADRTFGRRS